MIIWLHFKMKWNRTPPFCSLNVSFCANISEWVWFPVGSIIVRTRINIWYCKKTCFEFTVGQHQLNNKQNASVLQAAFSVDFFLFFYFRIKYSSFPDHNPPETPSSLPPLCNSLSFPSLSSTFLLFSSPLSSPLFVSPLFSSPVLSSPRPSVYPIWQSHLSWELSQGTRLLIQFLLNLMALGSAFAIRATCGKTKQGKKREQRRRRSLKNLSEESVPGWLN